MKRFAGCCVVILMFGILTGLGQKAMDPEDFSGQWYSSLDQSIYLFQEGLIFCPKYSISISDADFISGAYSHCNNRIYLFAAGIAGLETERELYLIHSGDSSFLCDSSDGFGKIYFIRYHK